jgi:hypothetical protein
MTWGFSIQLDSFLSAFFLFVPLARIKLDGDRKQGSSIQAGSWACSPLGFHR